VGGCAIAAILLTGFVLAASAGAGGHSRLQTIVSDTLGHHTDPAGYGRSPFGFWGQRSGWREWAMQPLVGTVPLSSPSWLCLLAYVAAASLLMRHRGPGSLALFCGVVALGFAVVKPHATATYLAWYYPLVVAGLCLPRFTSVPDEV
jgi:hypothetical protein